jgi:hypothetical protein
MFVVSFVDPVVHPLVFCGVFLFCVPSFRVLCPMSLDFPFLVAPSVFSNDYSNKNMHRMRTVLFNIRKMSIEMSSNLHYAFQASANLRAPTFVLLFALFCFCFLLFYYFCLSLLFHWDINFFFY